MLHACVHWILVIYWTDLEGAIRSATMSKHRFSSMSKEQNSTLILKNRDTRFSTECYALIKQTLHIINKGCRFGVTLIFRFGNWWQEWVYFNLFVVWEESLEVWIWRRDGKSVKRLKSVRTRECYQDQNQEWHFHGVLIFDFFDFFSLFEFKYISFIKGLVFELYYAFWESKFWNIKRSKILCSFKFFIHF